MRSRLPHKRDRNQPEIVVAFTALGCSVFDTSAMGGGFPDLVLGVCGENVMVEIKTKKGTLTEDQQKLIGKWRGTIHVIDSVDGACRLVDMIRGRFNEHRNG